ncbi:ras-related protein Rap-2c-like [Ambystoma mexicanum]|uniref:ras-related protein Rap-2c-like n=1 Tax=Ambystoma mexicanum TaxID=8296 RepID=UPI0037E89DC6
MTQAQKSCSDSGPTVRLVFLGAAGVGKTALIQRFLTGRFESRHRRTVEELHSLDCELGPRRVSLEVLDTSGSYAFPAMRKLSIRRAQAVALVFSLAEPGSFEEVQRLREEVAELRADEDPPLPVMVVGNQADLFPGGLLCRPPLAEHLAATAELEWGCTYLETSAKQDYNVQRLFQDLLLRVQLPEPGPAQEAVDRRAGTRGAAGPARGQEAQLQCPVKWLQGWVDNERTGWRARYIYSQTLEVRDSPRTVKPCSCRIPKLLQHGCTGPTENAPSP